MSRKKLRPDIGIYPDRWPKAVCPKCQKLVAFRYQYERPGWGGTLRKHKPCGFVSDNTASKLIGCHVHPDPNVTCEKCLDEVMGQLREAR